MQGMEEDMRHHRQEDFKKMKQMCNSGGATEAKVTAVARPCV